jgi:capsular polysaccharide export protein
LADGSSDKDQSDETRPLAGERRVFLFLQGSSSPLFALLAERLERQGHQCLRINFNVGDWIFWRRKNGFHYRGRLRNWNSFFSDFLHQNQVTNLILLGEERPYHKIAVEEAKSRNIAVHVVDLGYLRPDWVIFERDGTASNSRFPRRADEVLAQGRDLPEPDWSRRYTQGFWADAGYDILYNVSTVLLWWLYPFYVRHTLYHPFLEYLGWIGRLAGEKSRQREAAETIHAVVGSRAPFFVYPLQLQTDYQLRVHSPFRGQEEAIDLVLTSFARFASPDARLVVKLHPMDAGLINWTHYIRQQCNHTQLSERIDIIDGGNLEHLFGSCEGVVTVNSTAALPAIRMGKPVKVLGSAVYDIEGMTHQASLDTFWSHPVPPRQEVAEAFFRLMAHSYHVRGNLYTRQGAAAAAEEIAAKFAPSPL